VLAAIATILRQGNFKFMGTNYMVFGPAGAYSSNDCHLHEDVRIVLMRLNQFAGA